jgi:hypothetical protein
MSITATRKVLVIANETIEGQVLHDVIVGWSGAEVIVVAPAAKDRARREAAGRLIATVAALHGAGVDVDGWVGDGDPMRAIADALVVFPADELLIATHPEHRSNWLAQDLVARACARFSLPVAHIVVAHAGRPTSLLAA